MTRGPAPRRHATALDREIARRWRQPLAALCEAAGVPMRSLQAYRDGSRTPPLTTAARIADALGVSIENLLDRPRARQ